MAHSKGPMGKERRRWEYARKEKERARRKRRIASVRGFEREREKEREVGKGWESWNGTFSPGGTRGAMRKGCHEKKGAMRKGEKGNEMSFFRGKRGKPGEKGSALRSLAFGPWASQKTRGRELCRLKRRERSRRPQSLQSPPNRRLLLFRLLGPLRGRGRGRQSPGRRGPGHRWGRRLRPAAPCPGEFRQDAGNRLACCLESLAAWAGPSARPADRRNRAESPPRHPLFRRGLRRGDGQARPGSRPFPTGAGQSRAAAGLGERPPSRASDRSPVRGRRCRPPETRQGEGARTSPGGAGPRQGARGGLSGRCRPPWGRKGPPVRGRTLGRRRPAAQAALPRRGSRILLPARSRAASSRAAPDRRGGRAMRPWQRPRADPGRTAGAALAGTQQPRHRPGPRTPARSARSRSRRSRGQLPRRSPQRRSQAAGGRAHESLGPRFLGSQPLLLHPLPLASRPVRRPPRRKPFGRAAQSRRRRRGPSQTRSHPEDRATTPLRDENRSGKKTPVTEKRREQAHRSQGSMHAGKQEAGPCGRTRTQPPARMQATNAPRGARRSEKAKHARKAHPTPQTPSLAPSLPLPFSLVPRPARPLRFRKSSRFRAPSFPPFSLVSTQDAPPNRFAAPSPTPTSR